MLKLTLLALLLWSSRAKNQNKKSGGASGSDEACATAPDTTGRETLTEICYPGDVPSVDNK